MKLKKYIKKIMDEFEHQEIEFSLQLNEHGEPDQEGHQFIKFKIVKHGRK